MRIGIDLGGTKIEAVALSEEGSELARVRVATPREYGDTVRAVAELVRSLEAELGAPGSVGVGIPGTESQATGLIKNANSTWLIGHPLRGDLEDALARPVRLMNDANCFALSEATDGAGTGGDVVFGVILGTGVGGGLVIGEQALTGHQGIAGEWGHNPLPWPDPDELPGPSCYCGKRGCLETFLSGPGLERDHEADTGRCWSTHEISAGLGTGDSGAEAAYRRYVHRLGRGLASVVNIVDPDIIVLGGGMSNLPGLAASAQSELAAWVFTDVARTRVVQNRHGDSSGVRGAAWLWPANAAR